MGHVFHVRRRMPGYPRRDLHGTVIHSGDDAYHIDDILPFRIFQGSDEHCFVLRVGEVDDLIDKWFDLSLLQTQGFHQVQDETPTGCRIPLQQPAGHAPGYSGPHALPRHECERSQRSP